MSQSVRIRTYPSDAPDKPGRDVVFDKGFPWPNGMAKLVAAKLLPPNETPDHEYPFILHHRDASLNIGTPAR